MPTAINDDAGVGHPAPISEPTVGLRSRLTRRGALGRLLGLGAAATAAVALPQTIQAAPLAPITPIAPPVPVLPDWLTAEPWMPELVERFARALAAYPDGQGKWAANLLVGSLETVVRAIDEEPDEEPAPPPIMTTPTRRDPPIFMNTEDVATARIRRLTPNERRKARRWVAGLVVSDTYPVVRLRNARRVSGAARAYDFLDVAVPKRLSFAWRDRSPRAMAAHFAGVLQHNILMSDLEIELRCIHNYPDEAGSLTFMQVRPTA